MRSVGAAALALLLAAAGCDRPEGEGAAGAPVADRRIRVTATTGMVADLVRNVGGERVEVTALMGPGVDPHLYKASEGDIGRLGRADVVFYNGLHLEGKMGEILRQVGRRGRPVVAVAERIDPVRLHHPSEYEGNPDPHVWFDVSLWRRTLPAVVEGLAAVDPGSRDLFEANAADYDARLEELHGWCLSELATIPEERRVLVTAHDAFGYFGSAYDVDVVGLQGLSTAAEYGLKDVQRIVDVVVGRGVRAVFVESSVPRRSIEAVVEGCRARGHTVRIGGELFSDAMGPEGTPEGTYEGMVRANVDRIVEALK